jgi:hypothetical protein
MNSLTKPQTVQLYSADRSAIIHGTSACEDLVQSEGDKLCKQNFRGAADRPDQGRIVRVVSPWHIAVDLSSVSIEDVRIDRWRVTDRSGPSHGPSASAVSGRCAPTAIWVVEGYKATQPAHSYNSLIHTIHKSWVFTPIY